MNVKDSRELAIIVNSESFKKLSISIQMDLRRKIANGEIKNKSQLLYILSKINS